MGIRELARIRLGGCPAFSEAAENERDTAGQEVFGFLRGEGEEQPWEITLLRHYLKVGTRYFCGKINYRDVTESEQIFIFENGAKGLDELNVSPFLKKVILEGKQGDGVSYFGIFRPNHLDLGQKYFGELMGLENGLVVHDGPVPKIILLGKNTESAGYLASECLAGFLYSASKSAFW